MSDKVLRGKAWVAPGYVYAYDIIKQAYWTSKLDPADNSRWVMAGVDPVFDKENGFRDCNYSFIVAGHNFAGGGKSIEHVITGLMGAGVKAVLADSFARLQFRNAINYGFPFIAAKDIKSQVNTGDELEVDPATGLVRNLTQNSAIQVTPVADFVREIAAAGGMIPFIRQKIADGAVDQLK